MIHNRGRRAIPALFLLATAALIAGCSNSPTKPALENSFFPLTDNSSWTYTLADVVDTSIVVSVQGTETIDGKQYFRLGSSEPGDDTFDLLTSFRETGSGVLVYMSESNETLVNMLLGGLNFEGISNVTVDIDNPEWMLIRYPLSDGKEWSVGTMNVTAIVQQPGAGPIDTDIGITVKAKAMGNEQVVVPAGTFTAMRVDWRLDIRAVTPFGVITDTRDMGSFWFAEGVGLVKLDMISADVLELKAYSIGD